MRTAYLTTNYIYCVKNCTDQNCIFNAPVVPGSSSLTSKFTCV